VAALVLARGSATKRAPDAGADAPEVHGGMSRDADEDRHCAEPVDVLPRETRPSEGYRSVPPASDAEGEQERQAGGERHEADK
jgi:hypothetical protein